MFRHLLARGGVGRTSARQAGQRARWSARRSHRGIRRRGRPGPWNCPLQSVVCRTPRQHGPRALSLRDARGLRSHRPPTLDSARSQYVHRWIPLGASKADSERGRRNHRSNEHVARGPWRPRIRAPRRARPDVGQHGRRAKARPRQPDLRGCARALPLFTCGYLARTWRQALGRRREWLADPRLVRIQSNVCSSARQ